ncbi:DUF5817 domain-containing protein [Halomarina oriensis]|uniref:DUF5817 domain-containing protein n=1 Tax=Halomarina oriensis TaxID=671145 RepID=A0A6B0GWJ4_9EURY|nr:hypothetical protein [Halomarina oriensis]
MTRVTFVGCRECRWTWLVEDLREKRSLTCGRCGEHHTPRTIRKFGEVEETEAAARDALVQKRANKLIGDRDGQWKAYRSYGLAGEQRREVDAKLQTSDRTWSVSRDPDMDRAAEIYLDRRARELDGLVRASMERATERPDTEATPVDRAPDAGLTVGADPTVAPDVYLPAPPLAPTDCWRALYGEGTLRSALVSHAGDLLVTRESPAQAATDLTDAGVSALDGQYADFLLDLCGRGETRALAETLHHEWDQGNPAGLALTRQALHDGPLAALAHRAHLRGPPTVELAIPNAWHDASAQQRERFAAFLAGLAQGCDLRLVCSGLRARALRREFGALFRERLGADGVGYAENLGRGLDDADHERFEAALDSVTPDSVAHRVIETLAGFEFGEAAYATLRGCEALSNNPDTFRTQVKTAKDLGLVETHPGPEYHASLTNIGWALVDELETGSAASEQQTLTTALETAELKGGVGQRWVHPKQPHKDRVPPDRLGRGRPRRWGGVGWGWVVGGGGGRPLSVVGPPPRHRRSGRGGRTRAVRRACTGAWR